MNATVIDFQPVIQALLGLAALAITVLGGWAIRRAARLIGLKNDTELAKLMEPILQNALAYGQAVASQYPVSVDAKNAIVAQAANFALASLAKELRGVDRKHLEDMLLARLEANVSAQTPQVTATAAAPMPTTVAKPADPPAPPLARET